jgi:S1-C subfamily serine protease
MITSLLVANLILAGSQVPRGSEAFSVPSSLAFIGSKEQPTAVALAIGDPGLFIVPSSAVPSSTGFGFSHNGTAMTFKVIARDDITQFALIQAPDVKPGAKISMAPFDVAPSSKLVAFLPGGEVVSGHLASTNRIGILQGTRRFMNLWEIKLETPQSRLTGSPVFTMDGRLAALIHSTLEPISEDANESQTEIRKIKSNALAQDAIPHFGPQGLTVSYAFGPNVVWRVIQGFLRNDRTPQHPTIGLFFKNAAGSGAEVTAVTPGGSSSESGIQVGDVVKSVDELPVTSAVGFAALLFETTPGDLLSIEVQRKKDVLKISVPVKVNQARIENQLDTKIKVAPQGL